jgi:hypothetical protein
VAVALVPTLATLTAHQPVRALPLLLVALAVAAGTWLSSAAPPTRLQLAAVLVGGAALALAVPSLVFQVVGGNVNALVLVGSVAAWSLWVTGRSSAAGAAVGVLVVLKIVPLPIAVWCIGVAGRGGLRGLAGGGALAGLVSLAGAGIPNHVAYLDVVAGVASAGATDFSIAGWGRDYLGLPVEVARWLPFVALAAGLIAIVAMRRRPAVGFSLAVATMTLGFGAVHFHTYALLVAAAAPLAIPRATPVAEPAARTAGIARPRPARTTPALARTVSGPS